jgi:hypothetical protein
MLNAEKITLIALNELMRYILKAAVENEEK